METLETGGDNSNLLQTNYVRPYQFFFLKRPKQKNINSDDFLQELFNNNKNSIGRLPTDNQVQTRLEDMGHKKALINSIYHKNTLFESNYSPFV